MRRGNPTQSVVVGREVIVKRTLIDASFEAKALMRLRERPRLEGLVPAVIRVAGHHLVEERLPGAPAASCTRTMLDPGIATGAGAVLAAIHRSGSFVDYPVPLHCDFSPTNVLVHEGRVSGVIDPAPNGYWTTSYMEQGSPVEELANYLFGSIWRLLRRHRSSAAEWREMRDAFLHSYEQDVERDAVRRALIRHGDRYISWRFPHVVGTGAVRVWRRQAEEWWH